MNPAGKREMGEKPMGREQAAGRGPHRRWLIRGHLAAEVAA